MSTNTKPSSHRTRWPRLRAVLPVAGLLLVAAAAAVLVARAVLADEPRIAVSVTGARVDAKVLVDVHQAVERDAASICAALDTPCRFGVSIEVFPDQNSFDRRVMNPAMRGAYAISGVGRIQLVSRPSGCCVRENAE